MFETISESGALSDYSWVSPVLSWIGDSLGLVHFLFQLSHFCLSLLLQLLQLSLICRVVLLSCSILSLNSMISFSSRERLSWMWDTDTAQGGVNSMRSGQHVGTRLGEGHMQKEQWLKLWPQS